MNETLPPELAPVVAPGERVLWTGRAGRVGPGLDGCASGCFGAVFGGFALFWMAMVSGFGRMFGSIASGEMPAGIGFFPLFGLPFLLVGVGIFYSGVIAGPLRKSSGIYAVTDRRLLFLRTRPKLVVKEIPLNPHLRIEQTLNPDGSGTLAFLDPVSVHDPEGMTLSNPRNGPRRIYRSENHYTFHNIPDAAPVAHLIAGLLRR